MARVINGLRIVDAKLINQDINKLGKSWAIDYDADGFSMVNVTIQDAPQDIKTYLEGDNSITVYPVASNIDKLCDYALASFPNIEEIYLFKTSSIVILDDDLSYLTNLTKIYVPSDLLSAYQSAYQTIASKFDVIVSDYTLTIPYVGQSTLTTEYMNTVISMLSAGQRSAITKVVIPTDFTQESADSIAWGYNFNALPNLNDNIWYGTTQYDFTTLTIQGSGTLTSAIVSSAVAKAGSSVTKVIVPATFTGGETGCLNVLNNYLTQDFCLDYSCVGGINQSSNNYANVIYNFDDNSKLKEVICRASQASWNELRGFVYRVSGTDTKLEKVTITLDNGSFGGTIQGCSNLKIVNFDTPVTDIYCDNAFFNSGIYRRNIYNCPNVEKVYMLKNTTKPNATNVSYFLNQHSNNLKFYVKAEILIDFIEDSLLSTFAQYYVGVFTYNGTLPTVTGYTPTFYEDEDCTITILPANFVSGNRYFVKLQSI